MSKRAQAGFKVNLTYDKVRVRVISWGTATNGHFTVVELFPTFLRVAMMTYGIVGHC